MQWIAIGILAKTHGLKGEFKFNPRLDDAEFCQGLRHVRVGQNADEAEAREVQWVRGHGSRLILKLTTCNSIDSARELCGLSLFIRREDLPPLPPGEYYWFEIEGLSVYDESGRYYGRITEILATGSNDIYVVRDGGRELLLPVIEDVIKKVDPQAGKLIFHPIEGLIEDASV
jgi:16S rRNA processing protein RimM